MQARLNNNQVPVSLMGRKYIPVGGAVCQQLTKDYFMIAAPTMLLPQNIKTTNNAYYAMKAILKLWQGNGVLVIPILGGGVGRLDPETVCKQMKKAMDEYTGFITTTLYIPSSEELNQIFKEQPRIYENSEFIKMKIDEIKNTDINGNMQ